VLRKSLESYFKPDNVGIDRLKLMVKTDRNQSGTIYSVVICLFFTVSINGRETGLRLLCALYNCPKYESRKYNL